MVLGIRSISECIILLSQQARILADVSSLYVWPAHKRYFLSVRIFSFPSKSSAALRPDQGALVSSAGLSVPGHSLERIVDRAQSIAQPTRKNFPILVPWRNLEFWDCEGLERRVRKKSKTKQLLRLNKLNYEQSKKTIQYADLSQASQRVSPRIRRGHF